MKTTLKGLYGSRTSKMAQRIDDEINEILDASAKARERIQRSLEVMAIATLQANRYVASAAH